MTTENQSDAASPKKTNMRKKLLINPAFQKSFLLYTSGIGLITILFLLFTNFLIAKEFRARGLQAGLAETHVYFSLLNEQFLAMLGGYVLAGILVVTLTIVYGLYMSNKIAGPIYQLQNFFDENENVKTGKKVNFRKNDFFQELADSVNRFLERSKK